MYDQVWGAQIFLKILGASKMTYGKFHTDDSHISSAIVQRV